MSGHAAAVRLHEVRCFERPVTLRLPFRFGAATVTQCPQAFVRVRAEVDGRIVEGATAELMVPKWFDKSPALSQAQNFEQLRLALRLAARAYAASGATASAWQLSTRAGADARQQAEQQGLPPLAAQFGPAQLDKAVADAVLRALGRDWCTALAEGLLGDPWSASLPHRRPASVALRHTVGLADRLRDDEAGPSPDDGLPATLQAAMRAYGLTHFKLKLCGQADADVARLAAIAEVLAAGTAATGADWHVTLDGNESFADPDTLARAWERLRAEPALAGLLSRTLLLEQPLPRALTLKTPLQGLGLTVPVIIDEADDHAQAFETALSLGYQGVSSKACKGLYRSLQHAATCAARPGLLHSGEDLTCQAGLAVQQDTLLAASLGITHIERNGHHYVDGFGVAPATEAEAFARAHTGFYDPATRRLAVRAGRLDLASLHGSGFASAVHPQWSSLQDLA